MITWKLLFGGEQIKLWWGGSLVGEIFLTEGKYANFWLLGGFYPYSPSKENPAPWEFLKSSFTSEKMKKWSKMCTVKSCWEITNIPLKPLET